MLKIYNTLSKKKEEFIPLKDNQVTMYVCGPTVYNYIHIGNARSAVVFDMVRRYLSYRGYQVRFVSNFTDVDDKMINRAKEEHVLVSDLANRFIKAYKEDTSALNIMSATVETRATEFIPQIVSFISKLIDKGYAYESGGDVYFHTRKFKTYGALSDQSIDNLMAGASEHVNDEEQGRKEDLLDFALWKGQKGEEIAWDAPFGKGRPGWHIECSVMSIAELGETIDIHGGGEDLKFPHHENERAQSEALTEEPFVHYWMHNAFVTVDNDEKMSKSLNNFVTLREALKTEDPNFLRFFLVQTNYRKPLQYSQSSLNSARRNYDRIMETLRSFDKVNVLGQSEIKINNKVEEYKKSFIKAMDDDFNIQNALTIVFDYIRWINSEIFSHSLTKEDVKYVRQLLIDWLDILGVKEPSINEITDESVLKLIEQRNVARRGRDFQRSDELRDQLVKLGITIEDTPDGTTYTRK